MGNHGGPCDKACKFCYYAYQKDLVFFTLETLISHANKFRHFYDLEYCDISGGEATIFPKIERLVEHCARIGLKPTIITHGQNNTEVLVKRIEEAGLQDWLISMHGLAAGHDAAVLDRRGNGDGGWQRLVDNLRHCTRPIRFNATIQAHSYQELPQLAQWLSDNREPTVFNAISFNPFFAWAGKEVIEFQECHTKVGPFIGRAVQTLEANGWEVNVRYFPPCVAEQFGFAHNCVGFYGTQFDHWEWSLAATNRARKSDAPKGWHDYNLRHCNGIATSRANVVCTSCFAYKKTCEGPSEQYQKRFGTEELKPYA